jgi:type IV pilus assembly protein PilW
MKKFVMNNKNITKKRNHQHGLSLIELLVAMVLTLVLVGGAIYIFLGTRDNQKAQERITESAETGALALALLGRELANAGYYPSVLPPTSKTNTKQVLNSYPPNNWVFLPTSPTTPTPVPYLSGVYGCDDSKFNPPTSDCGSVTAGAADSIVINYFTSDAMGSSVGQRRDCRGADVGNDPVNSIRKLNAVTNTENINLPPQQPLFVSNRYALNTTNSAANKVEVDKQIINVKSLACNGNGVTSPDIIFQPLLAGIEDMQFTYGVYNTSKTLAPDKFYTATQVSALVPIDIDGVSKKPWERVVSVRVCLMTKTIGGNPKIADKTSALRKYVDCNEVSQTQLATDNSIYKRFVQTFGLRNQLTQAY